jgi:hypothetical protein
MKHFSVAKLVEVVLRPQPVLSHWMSLEPSDPRPRKIIKMMPLLSAKPIYKESRMRPLLKLETKFSKKRQSLKSKRRLLPPRLRPEKRECNNWTKQEPRR